MVTCSVKRPTLPRRLQRLGLDRLTETSRTQ
jgi:hypothetical protein